MYGSNDGAPISVVEGGIAMSGQQLLNPHDPYSANINDLRNLHKAEVSGISQNPLLDESAGYDTDEKPSIF